jgi:ParB family chromosome partitioning protein
VKRHLERILGKTGNHQHEVVRLNIGQIEKNPYQPRKEFDELELRDLARSIQEYGVIQPIIVRRAEDGFQLVAGERRLRACGMAGWHEVPAIIYDMEEEQAAAMSLVENLQRKDLNYFEEAEAYATLVVRFGLTQEEVAQRVGKSQSAIANKLRLLNLPDEIRDKISVEVISERQARALLRLSDAKQQAQVLQAIYQRGLNVRETETMVEQIRENISREINIRQPRQTVSAIIRDARIFLNTIKETVSRAQQAGVGMAMEENDGEDVYELIIRIPKK